MSCQASENVSASPFSWLESPHWSQNKYSSGIFSSEKNTPPDKWLLYMYLCMDSTRLSNCCINNLFLFSHIRFCLSLNPLFNISAIGSRGMIVMIRKDGLWKYFPCFTNECHLAILCCFVLFHLILFRFSGRKNRRILLYHQILHGAQHFRVVTDHMHPRIVFFGDDKMLSLANTDLNIPE